MRNCRSTFTNGHLFVPSKPALLASEAEKNRQARTIRHAATHSNGMPFHRICVENMHLSIHDEDVTDMSLPFGNLQFVSCSSR